MNNLPNRLSWPKLEGLLRLRDVGGGYFHVPRLSWFSVGDWKRAPEDHFRELGKLHDGRRVAIRSCAELEDSQSGAVPGQFKSVLQVDSNDFDSVVEAVETVISSYLSGGRNGINDLVLIQDFVADASHSGVCVAFGAGNYIEVEYVGSDGLTNDVTAGRQGRRICISPHGSNDAPWAKLGRAALRIAEELGGPVIIEFAVEKNVICILQARR